MINSIKTRTPILALILFVFAVGNTFAQDKVVVVPLMGGSELEAIPGPGLQMPGSLVPTQTQYFTEEITSKRSGYWAITKSIGAVSFSCTSQGRWYYILIDDVPVRSSARYLIGTINGLLMSGVTESVVPSGMHTVRVGSQCNDGSTSGGSFNHRGISSVIVIQP
jgi:hypothetical protein